MGGRNSILKNQTEFIEKNLNDLQFKIPEEEVQYIQNGIETLVYEIVNDISNAHVNEIERRKQYFMHEANRNGVKLKETFSREKLIKAGSFYEGTKNYFPNEFDFVFLLGTLEATECGALYHLLQPRKNYLRLKGYRARKSLKFILKSFSWFGNKENYDTYHLGNLLGEINFSHPVGMAGPAFKIQFLYKKPDVEDIEINVDIVPAFKLIDPFLTEDFLNENKVCTIPEFHRFIVETGSYIVIYPNKVSFVETEKRFISTVLSPQHKDVYRLVKNLINGDDLNETLKEVSGKYSLHNIDISSFTIKTTVIWHHFRCNIDSPNIIHRCSHVCAGKIILDLQKHVFDGWKRHILSIVESESRILSHKFMSSSCEKHKEWWLLGSKYLRVLGVSLNTNTGMAWSHLFTKTDKNYSQYMLEKYKKVYKKD